MMTETDLDFPLRVLADPTLTPDQKLERGFLDVCTLEQRDRYLGQVASGVYPEDAILRALGQAE